jgi:predicted nucleotidyltransferase
MLKDRILSTLRLFDLQDYPVSLLELHKFLLADVGDLKNQINTSWELIDQSASHNQKVSIDEVARRLDTECQNEVEQKNGFYCLKGRADIIDQRLANYIYGIKRERRIRKFIGGLKYLPFVRGAALAGSQAQGVQKSGSDIDLLIIVEPKFLWLGRTVVTAYFQTLGMRRHGKKIADRFCLNHYLAGVKTIGELRNLYTAWEYAKLRPLVYSLTIVEFQRKNSAWIKTFFPNSQLPPDPSRSAGSGQALEKRGGADAQSSFQTKLERLLEGKFGQWLEIKLKNWQLPKIRKEEFILVLNDELSFHPQSKQRELLQRFFMGF